MTKHLTSYVTLHLLWGGRSTIELAAPLPDCPAAPEPPALLSVCLFGSTTVAIPLGDMFERGELTNVLEDRIFFKKGNYLVLQKTENSQKLRISQFF
jgi:hypothetical protein